MAVFGLIHGGMHSASCWKFLETELHKRGHQSVAVELPLWDQHCGLEDYTLVADRAFLPYEDVIVVGHSQGGNTVLRLDERRRLGGIIFLCAHLHYSTVQAPEAPTGRLIPSDVFMPDQNGWITMPNEVAQRYFYHDCLPEMLEFALGQLQRQAVGVFSELASNEPSPLAVQRSRAPSIYVRASDDQALPREVAEWTSVVLTGDEPVVIPGGHSPFFTQIVPLADVLETAAKKFGLA